MAQGCYILRYKDREYQFVKVKAAMVDIGFDIKAFIYSGDDPDSFLRFWKVYDLATGLSVGNGYVVKADAIEAARSGLADKGIDTYIAQQRLKLEKYGSSPAAGGSCCATD